METDAADGNLLTTQIPTAAWKAQNAFHSSHKARRRFHHRIHFFERQRSTLNTLSFGPKDGEHFPLLTFPPHDQWKYRHRMPKSKTPCGARYSLIFRYITEALQKSGSIDKQNSAERKQRNRDRIAEYEAVQAAYRRGGYAEVEECLRLRPWVEVVTPEPTAQEPAAATDPAA